MGDFAHQMRWLADEAYTKAEKIRVVLDNLNTHRPASLATATLLTEHALREQPRPGQRRKLSGKQEAHVIAVACSTPPEGRGR